MVHETSFTSSKFLICKVKRRSCVPLCETVTRQPAMLAGLCSQLPCLRSLQQECPPSLRNTLSLPSSPFLKAAFTFVEKPLKVCKDAAQIWQTGHQLLFVQQLHQIVGTRPRPLLHFDLPDHHLCVECERASNRILSYENIYFFKCSRKKKKNLQFKSFGPPQVSIAVV